MQRLSLNIVTLIIIIEITHGVSEIPHIFATNWLSSRVFHNNLIMIPAGLSGFSERLFYSLIGWNIMRSTVFLPVALIKKANDDGWLRSLAYFVRLKSLYKNNTHYNYSLRSLAAAIKCSPACLSVHLRELMGRGLVRHHAGNITFLGFKKLQELYKPATIGVPVDFKNQYDLVRGQIIRFII